MCLGILLGWDLRQERLSFNDLLPTIQRRFRIELIIMFAILLLLCGATDTANAQTSTLPPALQAAINTGNQSAIERAIATLSGGNPVQAANLASEVANAGERLLFTNPMAAVAAESAAVNTVRSTAVQVAAPQDTQSALATAARVFVSPSLVSLMPDQVAQLAAATVQAAATTGNPTLIAAISAQAIALAERLVAVNPASAVALGYAAVQAVNQAPVLAAAPGNALEVAVSASRIIVNPDAQAVAPQTVASIANSTVSIVSTPSVYQTSASAAIVAMANAYAAVNTSTVLAAVPAAAWAVKSLLEQAAILNPSGAVEIQNIINAYEPANPTIALATTSATPSPSQLGQTVSIATTISPSSEAGNLSGKFTFYDGARVLGTGGRNDTAVSLDTATLSAGTNKLWVHYQEPAGGTYNSANSGVASLRVTTIAAAAVIAGPSLSVVGNRAVVSGDFNSDGKQDLAAIDDQGRVSIFLGKGDGTFEPAPGSPITFSSSALSAIVIADFNQDGNQDFAVADSNQIYLLLGNDDGSFSNGGVLTRSGQICGVVAADFNGDGRADLAVADSSSNDVTVYLGNGDATFTVTSPFPVPGGASPSGLAVALVDSDTIPDLVAPSTNDSVLVFLGHGDGTFAAPSTVSITEGTPSKVEIADYNGDGFADLAVISPSTGIVSLFMGDGGGTFTAGAALTTPSGSDIERSGDFNGDGKLDLFIASSLSGNLSVFLGNGDGTFQAQHTLANLDSVKDLALGEFNGDALTDLVVADYNNSSVDILLGSTAIPVTLSPSSLSDGVYGLAYSVTVSATGGVAPYTYAVSNGRLPGGLALTSSGVLSGTPTSAGSHAFTVTATDVNGSEGSRDFTLVVWKPTPPVLSVTNLRVTYNGSAQAATVAGSVAGTVSNVKYNGSSTLPTNVGTYAVTADFTPTDTNNYNSLSGASAGNFTISKAAAAVTPNDASKTYGAPDPTFTGDLSGFMAEDRVTAAYSRTAGETVAGSPYTISAALSPAAVLGNYDVTYGTAAFTITKAVTSAALQTSAANVMLKSDVVLTAKVTSPNGAPTGSITFLDGTTVLGSGAVDNGGTATLTVSTLAGGAHNLTAVYGGDSNFSGSTSTATNLSVQDFQLAISGGSVTSVTVLPGAVATYQLTLSPTGGTSFPAAVTLALTGLPAGATYTITPATIAAGSGTQTVTVRVQTAKVAASLHRGGTRTVLLGLALLPMLGLVHLGWAGARRNKRAVLMLCLLLTFGILGMTSCGGEPGFMKQASQTYNLQLNATSGALQHSAALTLIVQ